ncbi:MULTISPECIES: hypothetical protein [Vibrio]|uniref:hypothetical protein n=1 Tax=Vibrio TaxID=662 RepID=UPI001E33BB2D|nr:MULTISPECIES: hypothetical protein [Vibrio]MCC2525560.1 hypothetical protein [Vibrio coralliilyticus]USD35572.1 hypothetical protein J8Z27_22430 [Vibrio sp. SCSIO 43186]USD72696.1 hypothetical protein J4N41_22445 [Vibrio sp. SCSIO 43139]USD98911.1 hypothetical protein CTT30_22780 [Vibrio coralliilyticus]
MEQSEEEFYEELTREMDANARQVLDKNIQPLIDGQIDGALWCRNIAFEHHIPEGFSASYLKERLGLEVELLPEPEMKVFISCEACLGSPHGQCFECFSLDQHEPE